ncbi:MAG: hypothetical protein ACLS9T_05655 [Streptococcus salivarius]
MISSLLVLFVKNTLTAFVTTYFGVTGMTFFTLYLASLGDTMTKLMTYVPFSFMRAVFTSGQQFFSLREALVLFAWTLVLLLLRQLSTKSEPLYNANKVRVSSGFFFMTSKKQSKMSI